LERDWATGWDVCSRALRLVFGVLGRFWGVFGVRKNPSGKNFPSSKTLRETGLTHTFFICDGMTGDSLILFRGFLKKKNSKKIKKKKEEIPKLRIKESHRHPVTAKLAVRPPHSRTFGYIYDD
jgi:hypothetical protein